MITLTFKTVNKTDIEARDDVLGLVATITRQTIHVAGQGPHTEWHVRPYYLPPYIYHGAFRSLPAAQAFALAMAHETFETLEIKP